MQRKYHLLLVFFSLFIFLVLSGCISIDRYLDANKLDGEPEKYIVITEEQMNNFPHLKEAILTSKGVKTPYDEYTKVDNLLEETRNIKYMNEFYEIRFVTT